MDRAPDISASQERQGIARVHSESSILGLHPLPLARRVVLDLQRGDGLAEEQRPGAEVGVAAAPETADLDVLLGRVLGVLHVPEMVLALDLVPVDVREVVFRELECGREQDVQGVEHFFVQRLDMPSVSWGRMGLGHRQGFYQGEFLDLVQVVLDDSRVVVCEIAVKFWCVR